jgi:putative transposase
MIIIIRRVQKLFRIWFGACPVLRDMELSQKNIHWIIRQKQKEVGTKEIAHDMKISRRRVQQIWKYSRETGCEPVLGKKVGRPRMPYVRREAEIVKDTYKRYRFGSRMLESVIRKQYKVLC